MAKLFSKKWFANTKKAIVKKVTQTFSTAKPVAVPATATTPATVKQPSPAQVTASGTANIGSIFRSALDTAKERTLEILGQTPAGTKVSTEIVEVQQRKIAPFVLIGGLVLIVALFASRD